MHTVSPMTKIYATLGLPGSGKSTRAAEHCSNGPGTIANRDSIRFELYGKYWGKGIDENKVTDRQDEIVAKALANGDDVWIDDTNLSPKAQAHVHALGEKHGVEVEWVDFTDVPITQCIANDLKRDRSVGEDVIVSMWDRYLKPEPPVNVNNLPECAIFDLDGTLAIKGDRSPYDWKRVGVDTPNRMVVEYSHLTPYPVIILSGRDGSCRPETEEWLDRHGVDYGALYMRTAGDQRKDYVVKNELVDEVLEDGWFPILAVDDRQQVVYDTWMRRGIPVWQVAQSRF